MPGPAIALIELDSVAMGHLTADAMIKRAPLDRVRRGTVQPGKYLILISGTVAAVEESHVEAARVAGEAIIDSVLLPDPHAQVVAALSGKRQKIIAESLGTFETSHIPSVVVAADRAVKAADVTLLSLRLGDGLGGKGVVEFNAAVQDVEVALDAATAAITNDRVRTQRTLIARMDDDFATHCEDDPKFTPESKG